MRELELKFIADPARAAAIDAALARLPSSRLTIESRYHDTPDRRLAEAGLALRRRRTGRAWEQTLKASGASAVDRLEETVRRPGRWGPDGPPIDLSLHADTVAGARLAACLDAAAVVAQPTCTTRMRRRVAEIEVAGARIEIAFDRGSIEAGARSVPICEVEYELKAGDPRALASVARAGALEHGLWLSTISKFERGERLARGTDRGRAVKATPPRIDATMSSAAIERSIVRACLDHVLVNASEIAAGSTDAEVLHQLRVALRRLRTAARELGLLREHPDSEWAVRIAAAFRALGAIRDRQTVAAALRERLAAAGSPEPTLPTDGDPVATPAEIVRDAGFQCALLDLLGATLDETTDGDADARADADAVHDVDVGGRSRGRGSGATLQRARARLRKLHGELKAQARAFETLDRTRQHRVRKRLKRLRYLAELIGPLFDTRKVERYLDKLRPAQDALGGHNDIVVGLGLAQEAADRGDAKAWFNVGWLTADLAKSAGRSAKALARAATARPFWKGSDSGR